MVLKYDVVMKYRTSKSYCSYGITTHGLYLYCTSGLDTGIVIAK